MDLGSILGMVRGPGRAIIMACRGIEPHSLGDVGGVASAFVVIGTRQVLATPRDLTYEGGAEIGRALVGALAEMDEPDLAVGLATVRRRGLEGHDEELAQLRVLAR